MKKSEWIIGIALLFCNCTWVDRRNEYKTLTDQTQWIEEVMVNEYYWLNQLAEPSENDYFAEAEYFFTKLLPKEDVFSTFDATGMQKTNYGFIFGQYSDPTGKSDRYYARVLFVIPQSAAEQSGLKRGDWIAKVGGKTLTATNYGYLLAGGTTTFEICSLELDSTNGSYQFKDNRLLEVPASEPIHSNPFYLDSIYKMGNQRIGYLMYNSFLNEVPYVQSLVGRIERYKTEQITDLLIDLRFNTGGSLDVAQLFASMLIPDSYLGETFCSLTYNQLNQTRNRILRFNRDSLATVKLELPRLYLIISPFTAAAAEAFVYGLQTALGETAVVTIGLMTRGESFLTQGFDSPFGFSLYPVVAEIDTQVGTTGFSMGIFPNYLLDELDYMDPLYPLGNRNERVLKTAFEIITR